MSILIKESEMPNVDYQQIFIDWVEGVVYNADKSKVLGEVEIIPTPHGRLIEADKVIKSLFDYISGEKSLGQCIDECPTVIESEE